MEFDLKVESKSEIILKYAKGGGVNLAANPLKETVRISYDSLGDKDKPNGLKLIAEDSSGTSVTIALSTPKKPWDAGGIQPETFNILKKLFEEKNYDEVLKQFYIEKITDL